MPSDDIARFRQALIDNHSYVTKAREATFQLLINPEPQTIHEILVKARGLVDRVSVYRNVELFEKLGIVHRIYVGWKYKLELSDKFQSHHHHLSCVKCGRVIDLPENPALERGIAALAKAHNFRPADHQLEIRGLCQRCQAKISF